MSDRSAQVQQLKQLGLTRTEAEVYLALRREAAGHPISAYKVAQAMGRDPANLGKTLAALEKQGAVRLVQDRPRLYLPVDPATFTENRLAHLQEIRDDLVADLDQEADPPPTGLFLALPTNEAVLAKARELVTAAGHQVLIFASPEVLEHLADLLTVRVAEKDLSLHIISAETGPATAILDGCDLTLVPMNAGLSRNCPLPWLCLVTDACRTLQAQFNRPDSDAAPCGWWVDDPGLSGITAALLEQIRSENLPGPDLVPVAPTPDAPATEPPPSPPYQAGVLGSVQGTSPEQSPPSPLEKLEQANPADQPDEEDGGIRFVVRHDDD